MLATIGLGVLAATVWSGIGDRFAPGLGARVAIDVVAMICYAGLFLLAFQVLVGVHVPWRDLLPGAIVASVAWELFQTLGVLYVSRVLQGMSQVYGLFALVLGLFAWISLEARAVLYAAEINAVRVASALAPVDSSAAHRSRPARRDLPRAQPGAPARRASRRGAHVGESAAPAVSERARGSARRAIVWKPPHERELERLAYRLVGTVVRLGTVRDSRQTLVEQGVGQEVTGLVGATVCDRLCEERLRSVVVAERRTEPSDERRDRRDRTVRRPRRPPTYGRFECSEQKGRLVAFVQLGGDDGERTQVGEERSVAWVGPSEREESFGDARASSYRSPSHRFSAMSAPAAPVAGFGTAMMGSRSATTSSWRPCWR